MKDVVLKEWSGVGGTMKICLPFCSVKVLHLFFFTIDTPVSKPYGFDQLPSPGHNSPKAALELATVTGGKRGFHQKGVPWVIQVGGEEEKDSRGESIASLSSHWATWKSARRKKKI